MYKKLAELKVSKSADYFDEIAETLEDAGYLLVLETEGIGEKYYIITEKIKEEN